MIKTIEKILLRLFERLLNTVVNRIERWINADLDGDGDIGQE